MEPTADACLALERPAPMSLLSCSHWRTFVLVAADHCRDPQSLKRSANRQSPLHRKWT